MNLPSLISSWLSEPKAERGGRSRRHYVIEKMGEKALRESAAHARRLIQTLSEIVMTATIALVDDDTVDLTNLQRQIAHTTERVGQAKVESARMAMHALNPDVEVQVVAERADAQRLHQLVSQADIALDCSDNFVTRHALNAACVAQGVPLVSGAVIRWDGQLTTYDTRNPASPCYACVFPPDDAPEEVSCATMGVLAPLVGVIGSLQAAEALKCLSGTGTSLAGRLQLLDGLSLSWTEMRLKRQTDCPVCANRPALTRG